LIWRGGQPNRPSTSTSCRFGSLGTLAIPSFHPDARPSPDLRGLDSLL